MRHRRRRLLAWGTAASLLAGLATATTVQFHGHTAAESILHWLTGRRGAMTASRDGGAGAVRPPVSGIRARPDGVRLDDNLSIATVPLARYRLDDLSPPDARVAPDGALALNWPGVTVPGVVGDVGGVSGEHGESVTSVADGTTPGDGTTAAVVAPDPDGKSALSRGASSLPFAGIPGNTASPAAAGGGGGGLPSAGGSGGSTGGGSTGGSTGGGSSGGSAGGLPGGGGTGGGGGGSGGSGGGTHGGGGAVVPEPATWLLLIVGFGLVGVGQRRAGRPRYSGRPANSASR